MIRPKDCSRGNTNTKSKQVTGKNCSGYCSSDSRMCHQQKDRHSIGIDNLLQHTCTKKYQHSNTLDIHQSKSDSHLKSNTRSSDVSMTSENRIKTIQTDPTISSTVLTIETSQMPPHVQTRTASVAASNSASKSKVCMKRSKSMKVDKYEKRSNFNSGESKLRKQSDDGFFKSFDDLAAAMFQESNPFKKTSSLLRQQTTVIQPKKQFTIGEQTSGLQDSPKSVCKSNMSPKAIPNVERMKRKAGFTNANKNRVDKGQIDLEMVVSAKSTASTIGKVYKINGRKRINAESDSFGEGVTDNHHYENNEIGKERNRKFGRSKTVMTHDPVDNCGNSSGYPTTYKGKCKPRWTISIADPDGDVFEVKSNIQHQQDLKDIRSVCTINFININKT